MKKAKLSKILILVLAVALICTGLVLAVSADTRAGQANTLRYVQGGVEKTGDLAAVRDNADEGSTVTLLGDLNVTNDGFAYGVSISKALTIDLNGYTINSSNTSRLFNFQGYNKTFTITGSGTINLASGAGPLVKIGGNPTQASGENMYINIIGTGKGITINHNSINPITDGQVGTFQIKNVNITTAATGNVFNTGTIQYTENGVTLRYNGETNYVFEGVNLTATAKVKGSTAIVNTASPASTVYMNYCHMTTNGHSIISIPDAAGTAKVEDYVVVENSYLYVPAGTLGGTNNNEQHSSLVYKSYGTMASDVKFVNCYLSWNSRIAAKTNINGSAFIFDNCDIYFNGGSTLSLFRSGVVKFINGTKLRGVYGGIHDNNDNTGTLTVNGVSGVYLVLEEGTRFDENAKNKMVNSTGYKGAIVYPDGTSPNNSETYQIVFDPINSGEAPYVVVKKTSVTDPVISMMSGKIGYWSNNDPTPWHYAGTGTKKNIYTPDQNTVYKWVSNGSANTDGAGMNMFWSVGGTGVAVDTKSVFVVELDIASDSDVGFAATNFNLHARGYNAEGKDVDKSYGSFFRILNDGSVELSSMGSSGDTYIPTGVKLSSNEWNHVAVVIDTATKTGYIYINGQYMGSKQAYLDGANIYGPRFNLDINNAMKKAGTGLIFDNLMLRAYGDAPAAEALTDNGASYLVNGGKSWNEGKLVSDAVRVSGISVSDIDTALKLNSENGFVATLNQNIIDSVLITATGKIYTNGYTIKIADGSTPYALVEGVDGLYYDFDEKYAAVKVSYQFYTSHKTDAASLANPDNWSEVGETDLETILATLYTGTFKVHGKYSDTGYLTSTHIGWANTPNATAVRPETATLEEAESGEIIKLYPVFTYAKQYTAVILDENGEFSRDTGLASTFWGSAMQKVLMKYGETFVLNADVTSQRTLNNLFGTAHDPNDANCSKKNDGASENAYIGFDLNGFSLKLDANFRDGAAKAAENFITVHSGETVDVYSSRSGGKLEMFGLAYDSTTKAGNPDFASGGVAFKVSATGTAESNEDNVSLNVGTVNVRGNNIPGSNLTVITSAIIDVTGDSTCEINIDGIRAERNAKDYIGMFIARSYYGKINITNSTIIDTVSNSVISCPTASATNRPMADLVLDNCFILVNGNGYNVINNDDSFDTITVRNCTTNGSIKAGDKATLILGVGNKAVKLNASVFEDEDIFVASWNNAMQLPTATITTSYFTPWSDASIYTDNTKSDKYNHHNFVFAEYGYEGTADLIVPILAETTVREADTVTVSYTDMATGNTTDYLYAKGGNVVFAAPADYNGEVITGTFSGYKVNDVAASTLPTNVQNDVTVIAEYEFVANVVGLKANLSLYSDFRINLFIPVAYAENIADVNGIQLEKNEDGSYKTVTIGEAQYVKAVVSKVAKDAATKAIFNINVTEGGYTATKTVMISIVDYAATILEGGYTAADETLMVYMLNYIATAYAKFEGGEIADIADLIGERYNYEFIAKNYANEAIADTNLGKVFSSASVVLGEAPAFKLVFNNDASVNNTFAGKVTVTYGDGNVREYTVNKGQNEACEIVIDGMKIYNFGTTVKVTVTPTEGSATVGTINYATYANYHINVNPADIEVQALIEALYEYVKVAEMYKAGTLEVTPEA